MIQEFAPAKLNLTLEVLGQRPNGWHEICSIMQTIDLADELTLQEAQDLELFLDCSSLPAWDGLRTFSLRPEDNLAYRAAMLLREATPGRPGAKIWLKKHIPSAAGLGGGSSDAAAVLRGLNRLWRLSLDPAELTELGAKLGADVPFFLHGGTCLVEGLGERVTPLPPLPPCWAVLLLPPLVIPEKTHTLYSRLKPSHYTRGQFTKALKQALLEGKAIELEVWNVFSLVSSEVYPGFERYQETFRTAGAKPQLAGSGPTLFSLFKDEATAREVFEKLKNAGGWVYLARTRGNYSAEIPPSM